MLVVAVGFHLFGPPGKTTVVFFFLFFTMPGNIPIWGIWEKMSLWWCFNYYKTTYKTISETPFVSNIVQNEQNNSKDKARAAVIGTESGNTNLIALTWNACDMEKCAEQDLIDLPVDDHAYWDALLIQEGPLSEESGCKIIQGWHLFCVERPGATKRTSCILTVVSTLAARKTILPRS